MAIPNREAPPANQSLEARLARVEDQLAIRDLTARYNFAMDNRDLASASLLFMPDGSFGSKDGAMRATGIDAIVTSRSSRWGPTVETPRRMSSSRLAASAAARPASRQGAW